MLVNAKSLRVALENTLLGFLYENSYSIIKPEYAVKVVKSIPTDGLLKAFRMALKTDSQEARNLTEHYENYIIDSQNKLRVLNEGLNQYKINNIAKNNLLNLYEAYVCNDTVKNRDVLKTLHETYQRRISRHPVLEKYDIVKEIYNGYAKRYYSDNKQPHLPSLYPFYSAFLVEPRFLSHYVCHEAIQHGDTLKVLKEKVYNSLDYLMDKYLSENNLLKVFGVFQVVREWKRFFAE